ncbi:MAG TPA: SDR family oxidoreductase [Chthoniobacteraceae bacterium]|jgi:NAD(P)-dependent dehydrogenase (short-subunit alcohol dehydrogenase family)
MSTPKQVALVTGANKGLGFEIARQLGRRGITVLIGSRDKDKGRIAAEYLTSENIDAHGVILDVTHFPSIERVRHFIEQEYGRLDILVNNAGIHHDWTLKTSDFPVEITHEVFETNFFGVISVTNTLLSLLRKSEAARIVNVSSTLGSLSVQSDPASPYYEMKTFGYNASKTALNAYTVHLAHELRETPIKVNSACPGWVKTDMGGENAPGTVEQGADTPVWLATLPADGPTGGFFNSRESVPW